MGTLVVAMLIVAVSAAGFGFALFGRRPAPQPAMASAGAHLAPAARSAPEPAAPVDDPGAAFGRSPIRTPHRTHGLLRRRALPASDPTISRWTRVRASLLLALTVVGLAALIGAALSILVVGLVLLVT